MPSIAVLDPKILYPNVTSGYSFRSWSGETLCWPRNGGSHLGQCGAYNFFLRAGFKPVIVELDDLDSLGRRDMLVVDLPESEPADPSVLDHLTTLPCQILFTGDLSRATTALGEDPPTRFNSSSPYNSIGVTVLDRTTPLQPANWGGYTFSDTGNFNLSFPLFEIAGDRLSPATALRIPIPGAFLLAKTVTETPRYLLNGMPFAALQAWLQGQEDLTQWQSWNTRQHWLDDYVDLLFDVISPLISNDAFDRIELPASTVCLRHDNDDSVDATFAEFEESQGVEATYALLNDANLAAWHGVRDRHPRHEYALHYTTIAPRYALSKYAKFALSLTPLKRLGTEHSTGRRVLGDGKLIKQVAAANAAGIGVTTLHRHFAYLPYPEIIDAFHGVYASGFGVLATASFFRGNLYRWGMDELDGAISSNAPWPDVQFPYWLPFRMAHAARQGEILPGWECTMMMEAEPDFVRQVLVTRHRNLPHKFAMLCYHPSNTVKSPLIDGGTLSWLKTSIDVARDNGYGISRYDHYIATLSAAVKS